MRIDNPYLLGKIFENISPDSVRIQSGPAGPVRQIWGSILSGQETHMPSPVEPYSNHPLCLLAGRNRGGYGPVGRSLPGLSW